jgi:hypothetical protein
MPGDGYVVPIPETVVRPPDLPPVGRADWSAGGSGTCLVQVAGEPSLAEVNCDEPHDLQRVDVGELDSAEFGPTVQFDPKAVDTHVAMVCAGRVAEFLGRPVDDAAAGRAGDSLDAPYTRPSFDTWAAGERSFQCFVGIGGRRLVGDGAGSGS